MKVSYNQTSTFEDLQKAWNKLCTGIKKSAFDLFEKESYDDTNDILLVKHPDINSTKPLVRGTVRMQIKGDVTGCAADIDNPTWGDVAMFFTDYGDSRYNRLRAIRLEDTTFVKKDKDDKEAIIKTKALNLYASR